ncbi:hypothetical protein [Sphingomicrobium arenosum]|uniref:hypothetical protein n=1 Tax=Sphingomicrobium arenosum TaxID=2233861 RepID=UPI002240F4C5|nr:hypothetical protein [Sphingomicrobium arenosum]
MTSLARQRAPRLSLQRLLVGAIVLFFFLFGLVRVGVGALMFAAANGWWTATGEMAEGLAQVAPFLAERADRALVFAFTPASYFLVIMAMGVVLVAGAMSWWRGARRRGVTLIFAYLALHGGLFLNYLEVNPKLLLWGVTVAMWGVLVLTARPQRVSGIARHGLGAHRPFA